MKLKTSELIDRFESLSNISHDKTTGRIAMAVMCNIKALTLYDNAANDSVICEMLGHSNIETTRKYYIYSNKTSKSKIEQVSKAINF